MPVESRPKNNFIADPHLPQLKTALDSKAMAEVFDRYLVELQSSSEIAIVGCSIEKVHYHPAKHCRILYRLRFENTSGDLSEEWVFAKFTPPQRKKRDPMKRWQRPSVSRLPGDFLRSISPEGPWRDLRMIFWVFPDDPKIAHLPLAVDKHRIAREIERNIAAFGPAANAKVNGTWTCQDIHIERIKYMPRKRCVLRIGAELRGTAGEMRHIIFYSKTLNRRNDPHFSLLTQVYEKTAKHAILNIPKPLVHASACQSLWQEDWAGQPLLDNLGQSSWNALLPRLAELIANLHKSPLQGLSPGDNLDHHLAAIQEDGRRIRSFMPEIKSLIDAILTKLEWAKPRIEEQASVLAPTHGAFRIEQILTRGAELALIDFDALALSDPLLDVAEFVASLEFLALSREMPVKSLLQGANLFLQSYEAQVSWECDNQRIAWYVLGSLLTKFYLSYKHLNTNTLSRISSRGLVLCNRWMKILSGNRIPVLAN